MFATNYQIENHFNHTLCTCYTYSACKLLSVLKALNTSKTLTGVYEECELQCFNWQVATTYI